MNNLKSIPGVNIVAVCDIWEKRSAYSLKFAHENTVILIGVGSGISVAVSLPISWCIILM
jgi:hypothetical protein